ncbi:MAG TPA: carbon starvation protein A [Pirellulales bacterium]|jgi:carbon starvation protein|nr:carbon starvation protein A [Pirellulales bacterium]
MSAMPLMIVVLCCLAIAYRYYSAFLAAKVLVLDDRRVTPAHRLNDGQNYHPTHKWVLFGHHFAAISGAGPLIGPVLAIQYGYLPGLIWIVVGVCLAGAVQDMLVLGASVRWNGRSLAEIARAELGAVAGGMVSVTILFVVIIALSGLGVVVVNALGGEEVQLAGGTKIELLSPAAPEVTATPSGQQVRIPGPSRLTYPNDSVVERSESFTLILPGAATEHSLTPHSVLTLPPGAKQQIPGSSWGTFTIACTIPIALFIGLYMYKLRKGRVIEASLLGAAAVLAATVAGHWIPNSPFEKYFLLSREGTIGALCVYGFIASVLPVWMLLCPRDYLSSFLKIGTVAILVGSVIVANPTLHAPTLNQGFAAGGPTFPGAIFPFCFICIMCGAVSGFHALVSSGTTPKMIGRESDVRTIGYGAMLMEGLVAVVALIAAASLPSSDYYAINMPLAIPKGQEQQFRQYAETVKRMDPNPDNLARIEQQVGNESLRGRTGGAVTLAVGMSNIITEATHRVAGNAIPIEGVIEYWYHFAIMFEALFIMTTIDTGTRIGRFLLQEFLGKFSRRFDQTDWLPGAALSTGLVVVAWGGLIATGSIATIWPMFGIANQLLAVIALAIVSTYLANAGRARYLWVTIPPMLFVIATTLTAGYQMITAKFWPMLASGWSPAAGAGAAAHDWGKLLMGGLNIFFILFMATSVLIVLTTSLQCWLDPRPPRAPTPSEAQPEPNLP